MLGVIECRLQGGSVLQERGAQAIDGPDAVVNEVQAPGGQQAQVDAHLVSVPDRAQVGADARLISDDPGVLGVRLPVTAVGGGRVMDDATGDVHEFLRVSAQQGDQL